MKRRALFGDSDGWADEDFELLSEESTTPSFWKEQPTQTELTTSIENSVEVLKPTGNLTDASELQEHPPEDLPEDDGVDIPDTGPQDGDDYAEWADEDIERHGKEVILSKFTVDGVESAGLLEGVEFEEGLAEPAFPAYEHGLPLERGLEVDRWLAEVKNITGEEREEARRRIMGLRPSRFGTWLPWLRERYWNGDRLLAFLRFQAYWDSNWQLWEIRRFSGYGEWRTLHSRNSMSREDALKLATSRIAYAPNLMIDPAWFNDWCEINGAILDARLYYTFAKFALFRATMPHGEDWTRWPEIVSSAYGLAETPLSRSMSLPDLEGYVGGDMPEWFGQDGWYGANEWHDGQGG